MVKIIDLSGQVFGRLTVIKMVDRPDWAKDKSIYYLCRCSCNGKEIILSASTLRNGHTKSCGCLNHKNLTGEKFGILTVIEYYGLDRNRKRLWKCECECGNEKIAETSSLLKGYTKSCGCLKHKKEDLVGQKFGMLTVKKRTKVGASRNVYWLCECECGNEKEIMGRSLKSGGTKSCGCLALKASEENTENLVGKRFGKLMVIEKASTPEGVKSRGAYWKCKCDCEGEKIVSARNLKGNVTNSCGCYRKNKAREDGYSVPFKMLFHTYKRSASNRNYVFSLSKEKFKKLTEQNCYYCGKEPNAIFYYRTGRKIIDEILTYKTEESYIYNGVDRIDNNKGYEEGNVVPCCKDCNLAKGSKNLIDFLLWVKSIYDNLFLNEKVGDYV